MFYKTFTHFDFEYTFPFDKLISTKNNLLYINVANCSLLLNECIDKLKTNQWQSRWYTRHTEIILIKNSSKCDNMKSYHFAAENVKRGAPVSSKC